MEYEPDENERAVLDVLREERRVNPMRVRDQTDIRKQYVNDALRQLRKLGVVEKVNRGLYEYVPEEDDLPGAPEAATGGVDVEAARAAWEDACEAWRQARGEDVGEALDELAAALGLDAQCTEVDDA